MSRYRPPRDCPVCSSRLQITQLGCTTCGTGLTGEFRPCEFCGLDDADRDVLRVFLGSRGNMKELERHLGVSYPTARARFEDLLRKLDLAPAAGPSSGPGSSGPGSSGAGPSGARSSAFAGRADDERLATLRAVAAGELSVDGARVALTDLDT